MHAFPGLIVDWLNGNMGEGSYCRCFEGDGRGNRSVG